MNVNGQPFRTVWMDGATVRMINQPLLPYRFELVALPTVADTAASIRDMVVRGAGAIGATAAYGVAQAAQLAPDATFFEDLLLVLDDREADARILHHEQHLVGACILVQRHRDAAERLGGTHHHVEVGAVVADDGLVVTTL